MPVSAGWYTTYNSSDDLLQGVIINDFPLVELGELDYPNSEGDKELPFQTTDVIVLTQSCDLQNNKVKFVHLAPLYSLESTMNSTIPKDQKTKKPIEKLYEELRKGFRLNAFLLEDVSINTVPKLRGKKLVARYDEAVVIPVSFIEEFFADTRRKNFLALKSPYRESLSQGYGRFFMRVANPIDYTDIDFNDYT